MKEFKVIESKENSLIKLINGLQNSAKKRKENSSFVLEGLRICKDAYENDVVFEGLVVSNSAFEKLYDDICLLAEKSENCYKIPDNLFKKISDTTTPQGIIAIAKAIVFKKDAIDKKGRYIALENIQDPSNLGAVARTAEALGVSGIIVSDNGCDPYSPKSLRASMGTLLRMPIFTLADFSKEIAGLGLKTYACVVDTDAQNFGDIKFSDGSVLIIGNEANGITDETKSVSDMKITIPMKGNAESLNAAVAASIAMWEMMK